MERIILTLSSFQSHEIEKNWKDIEPFVKRVLQKIDLCYTIDNIKDALKARQMQLWTSYTGTQLESVCITRMVVHPKAYKILEIVLMAGKMQSVPELRQIEQWGKDNQCRFIRLEGRRGWQRKLKDYQVDAIILQKEL